MKWKTTLATSVLAAIAMPAMHTNASVIDFNTTGELNANFTVASNNKYSEADAIGLDGTRGVDVANNSLQGSRAFNTSFDGSSPSATVSIFFQYTSATNNGGAGLFIGIGPDQNYDPAFTGGGVATNDHIMVTFQGAGGASDPDTRQLNFFNIVNGDSPFGGPDLSSSFGGFDSAEYVDGNWYKLELVWTFDSGDGLFDLTATIQNSTADGTLGATVASIAASDLDNPSLRDDGTVYAFFGSQAISVDRGIDTLDNFEVDVVPIPEPGSLSLIGLGGLLVLARRRKHA